MTIRSERDKMDSGDWYIALGDALEALRVTARSAVHAHNNMGPVKRGAMAPDLRKLLGRVGTSCFIEAPFHVAYGINTYLGDGVYMNAGCTILDTASVTFGDGAMLGPGVQIYCAEHHKDAALRSQGLERAQPVTIGSEVWIGGGAIILPGVTIGDRAIVGAGAVVTRDVDTDAVVVGNPARPKV